MGGKYILEATGIDKAFSGVTVLKGAELCIEPGELHALMGENGAGKSTLMKIIMGIYTKDAGKVVLDGKEVEFKSSREALDAGISMIHQELSPIPEMTVAENVFLGREQKKIKGLPFVDKKQLNQKTQELLVEYELDQYIKPTMKMKNLNIAQIQMMEIIKAVSYNSKVIIMDEPTSSLSEKETETLFHIIDNLRAKKVGIIYISHRMEEVFELADRVSVLRDGQFIGCMKVADASREQLINMMVGRELEGGYPTNIAKKGDVVLELKNFTRKGVFEDVNLKVRSGEILGLAGLVGAGRSEVMRALVGYDKLDSGEIYLEGKQIPFQRVSGLADQGSFETLREGGRNSVVYSLKNQADFQRTVTLERGLLSDEMEMTLYQPGYRFREEVSVFMLGQDQSIRKAYYLQGCVVNKISLSDLAASESTFVTATIELSYEALEEEGSKKNSAWWKPGK